MNHTLPRLLRRVFGAVVLGSLALALSAAEAVKKTYRVPAGDAAATLKQFTEQSGEQVVYLVNEVRGVATKEIAGDFTAREALNRMIAGTELALVQDEKSGALTVNRLAPDAKNAPSRLADAQAAGGATVKDGMVQLDRFDVRSTRVDGLNNKGLLQGGAESALYHDVVTRTDIERMGVTSVEELFRRLPQTSAPTNPLQDAVNNTGFTGGATTRVSTMGLRGFASAQTVILINGRSLPRTGTSDGLGADLGRIPLAAIERVEILPYAGSAIYGAGAIGGAINIILRKEYTGKDLMTYFGTSTDGGATEYRVNYVDGRTFNDGRSNLTLTFSYQHREPLYASDRGYLDRALERYGPNTSRRLPSGVSAFEQFMLPALAGAPATIAISSSASPTLDLGIPGAPGARYAAVPRGTTPTGSLALTPGSFADTAGRFTRGNRYGRSILYEPVDSYALNGQIEHEFIKDRLSGYGEFTVSYSRKSYRSPQALSLSLSAADPLNPFRANVTPGFAGRPVTVFLDAVDIPDPLSVYEFESARAVVGLKGRISEHWEWSTDGVIDYTHNTVLGEDTTGTLAALYDPAGRPSGASAAVRRAIYPILADHTSSPNPASDTGKYFRTARAAGLHGVQQEVNARLMGDLFELPAGPLKASVVSKFQDWSFTSGQSIQGTNDRSQLLLGTNFVDTPSSNTNSRGVWQNAVEVSLPVLSRQWRPLPVESLEIQASASYETVRSTSSFTTGNVPYTYTKNADSQTVAGKLQITPDVAVRASLSSAFYPPGWSNVSSAGGVTPLPFGFFPDAARGNTVQATPWNIQTGGNPALRPEQAESHNFGVIFTPRFLPGLTVNVDYWTIEKTDAVTTADLVAVWGNPSLYSFATVRAAPSTEDAAKGWLGVVTDLILKPINAARIETEGIDTRIRYDFQTETLGSFSVNANASFTNNFLLQISPTAPAVNQLNAGGSAPLKWRGNGSLTWTKSRWSTTVTGRYVGHYSTAFTSPSAVFPAASGLDGGRIPAYLHWDIQASYEVPAGTSGHLWRDLLAGTKWTLGVNNVLNDEPAFVTGLGSAGFGAGSGFYNTFDDPRQRFVYLQIRKSL